MAAAEANAITVKLPPFWPAQPAIWFIQAEAQFQIRGIVSDDTKYHHVVSALDQETASRLIDVLTTPPATDKYEGLKKRLTATFSLGRRERASRLLRMQGLGDRKPSQLMDEMLSLMDGHAPCFLFEQIFLEQLPEDVRLQLADQDFTDPRAVAIRADSIWLARGLNTTVMAAQQDVSAASRGFRPPVQAPATRSTQGYLCFYHRKFGKNARTCVRPCTWTGNELAGRQ